MRPHVLIAEDNTEQAAVVRRYMEHEGYEVSVAEDGRSALGLLRSQRPDLLVLDVMMPHVDGLDVCRIVRADPVLRDVPMLMLTARSSEDDLLLGLDLGADDYMTKPFSPRELMARVRSLLRRRERGAGDEPAGEASRTLLRAGHLTVDPARHEVRAHNTLVRCTPGEFRLLEMLAERPGQVLSRTQILERLHGADPFITPRTIDVHVMNLRRKIRDVQPDGPHHTPLVTVYGVGYKLTDGTRTEG
ncbi:response regulator transcription factor [Streptacidiphilus sp. ASG 303]|uniref:response regulator transcription factor n=1 Tax=Streptacidiphilus sp. ASG 303 TaxID=2896847 RepID=UPI001E3D3B2F|nr:response regulator transcription factor [Streptacidiphilus sp. ASG 303]MCD0484834.1 response regulator transcription factor [Streptacidiphilus sp. ASG 303]